MGARDPTRSKIPLQNIVHRPRVGEGIGLELFFETELIPPNLPEARVQNFRKSFFKFVWQFPEMWRVHIGHLVSHCKSSGILLEVKV